MGRDAGRARPEAAGDAPIEHISDWIKQAIADGRFAPGQRLIESELIVALAASRSRVREALRFLAGEGILELVPQKGARVRKLERADFAELMPVLAALLRITLQFAIPHASEPPFRARLAQAMDAMRVARQAEDFVQFQLAGLRYADVLIDAGANRYLRYLNDKLHPELFHRQFASAVHVVDWDGHLAHFERVHQAVLAGDARRAVMLIERNEAQAVRAMERGEPALRWR